MKEKLIATMAEAIKEVPLKGTLDDVRFNIAEKCMEALVKNADTWVFDHDNPETSYNNITDLVGDAQFFQCFGDVDVGFFLQYDRQDIEVTAPEEECEE